jgi:hypothetical protein
MVGFAIDVQWNGISLQIKVMVHHVLHVRGWCLILVGVVLD